jgi:periplasmic protein TonB
MDLRIPLAFAMADARVVERDPSARRVGLAAVVLLHAALLGAIVSYAPVRQTLARAAPVMVRLIDLAAPPVVVPPKPLVAKPVPRVAPVRTAESPPVPVLETQAPVPSLAVTAPPVVTPEIVRNDAPVASPAPAAPPPATIAPRFDAAYLDNPAPAYPPLARRAGEQGRVLLRVHVGADGLPDDVQVRETSGFARLDAAAQETVRRWRFVPARQGDRQVPAWVLVPITFALAR